MKIQHLKYLVEISKQGSINKAAKALYVSQPSISRSIKELEEDLGIEIFSRNNKRKLVFTEAGMELLWRAKEIMDKIEKTETSFKEKSKHISLFVSSQHYAFGVKAFIEFSKRHSSSHYNIVLREKKTEQIIDDIMFQQSHVGIIFISEPIEAFMYKYLSARNLEFYPIKTVPFYAFIRKGHPLSKEKSVTLKDLEPYPFISYEQETEAIHFSEEAVEVNSTQKISVLDRGTLNNIICHTNSYNIGSGFIIKGIIEEELISIPVSDIKNNMTLGWIKRKDAELPMEAKEFIDLCYECIE